MERGLIRRYMFQDVKLILGDLEVFYRDSEQFWKYFWSCVREYFISFDQLRLIVQGVFFFLGYIFWSCRYIFWFFWGIGIRRAFCRCRGVVLGLMVSLVLRILLESLFFQDQSGFLFLGKQGGFCSIVFKICFVGTFLVKFYYLKVFL